MNNYKPDEDRLTVNGVKRKVVCAANKYGDNIVIGIRHHCPLMNQNLKAIGEREELRALREADKSVESFKDMQGFVDQWGNYMTRREALHVAVSNGQEIDWGRNGSRTLLYSEGLY